MRYRSHKAMEGGKAKRNQNLEEPLEQRSKQAFKGFSAPEFALRNNMLDYSPSTTAAFGRSLKV